MTWYTLCVRDKYTIFIVRYTCFSKRPRRKRARGLLIYPLFVRAPDAAGAFDRVGAQIAANRLDITAQAQHPSLIWIYYLILPSAPAFVNAKPRPPPVLRARPVRKAPSLPENIDF